jgi:tetratricopeptide (TPR) repeat protein
MKRILLLALIALTLAGNSLITGCKSDFYSQGINFFDDNKYEQAIANFTKAIELDANNANAYAYRSLANFSISTTTNLINAEADANKAVELIHQNALGYSARGLVLAHWMQLDDALVDFNKAIDLDNDVAFAYIGRADVYNKRLQIDLALNDANKGIQLKPKYAYAYNVRGTTYFYNYQSDLAIQDFSKAIQLNPQDNDSLYTRGINYRNQQKYDLAISDFSGVIEDDPGATIYICRAECYVAIGNYDSAIEDATKAIELDKQDSTKVNSDRYLIRAIAYDKKGQLDLAKADYVKSLEEQGLTIGLSQEDTGYVQSRLKELGQ